MCVSEMNAHELAHKLLNLPDDAMARVGGGTAGSAFLDVWVYVDDKNFSVEGTLLEDPGEWGCGCK